MITRNEFFAALIAPVAAAFTAKPVKASKPKTVTVTARNKPMPVAIQLDGGVDIVHAWKVERIGEVCWVYFAGGRVVQYGDPYRVTILPEPLIRITRKCNWKFPSEGDPGKLVEARDRMYTGRHGRFGGVAVGAS